MKNILLFFAFLFSGLTFAGNIEKNTQVTETVDVIRKIRETSISMRFDTLNAKIDSIVIENNSLSKEVNNLQNEEANTLRKVYGLMFILVVFVVSGILYYKKFKIKPKSSNSESMNLSNLSNEQNNLRIIIRNQASDIGNLKVELNELKNSLANYIRSSSNIGVKTIEQRETPSIDYGKSNKSVKMVKYAMFAQNALGNMAINNRSLSDDATGAWFMIEYTEGSDTATYTVNPLSKSEILSDLNTFKRFTKDFSISGNVKDIKIEKIGTLVKKGISWEIENKLQVQIV